MKNILYVGTPNIDLPRGGCLLIDSKIRDVPEWRHPRIFDPFTHSFNPLDHLDYRKSCDIVDIFDALYDKAGATTLTKEAGLEWIADLLERRPKTLQKLADLIPEPDRKSLPGQVWAYNKVRRILRSPILGKVFCAAPNFSFKRGSVNQLRVDRAELGLFDATALVLFAIAQYQWQIIIPEFNRYARPFHSALIDESRLIAGVRTLSQLDPSGLRDLCMSMEKIGCGCIYKDAVELAQYAGKRPDPTREKNPYNEFIDEVMA